MNKSIALLLLSAGVPAFATTYNVSAGASAGTIQSIVNEAGGSSGNTVLFAAGSYQLNATVYLPCGNGTVYTGANVGVVTQTHLPTAVFSSNVPTNYALAVTSNGTSFSGAQGCTIQYLRFTGSQGGIFVDYPSSGIVIQQNAFDNNNPPAGGYDSTSNIYVDGQNWSFTPNDGVTNITIVWNTFFNNCQEIRDVAWPDSGGGCSSTWVNAYNKNLIWSNNTVNLTEEGLKLSQATADGIASINADVENNNFQGNSRILIESQQDTDGTGTYSHNAFYQPYNPSYNTFELSIPEWSTSISPTHVVDDNVFIGNVPVTIGGQGGHYGIGLELWGSGSIATNNLFQGGNGPDTCAAGWGCSGWGITVGEPYTNANITNNYFSGTNVWNGSDTDVGAAVTYEDGGSTGNPGIVLSPNTIVQTSTTLPITAPTISVSAATGTPTVTLKEPNTAHTVTIFYTTDGSTPKPFGPGGSSGTTRVYSAPFAVPGGSTVKAIASWGQGANQGITFPSFGYVPSTVATAAVGGSSTATIVPTTPTLVSAYLTAPGAANTLLAGHGLQFTAWGVYSDGSVKQLPDATGHKVTGWNTNNHKVAKVNTAGKVSALATGSVDVQATIGTMVSNPWTITVLTAQQAAPPVVRAHVDSPGAPDAQPDKIGPGATSGGQPLPPSSSESSGSSGNPGSSAGTPSASAGTGAAGSGSEPPTTATPTNAAPANSVIPGPAPEGPSVALADTFQGPLWMTSAPAGGTTSISNGHLFLGVPGGSNHSPFESSNNAVRVTQAIGNEDFDVAMKIDSPLYATDAGTSQGLMVLSDDQNFVTFALETDGTKVGLSAHTVNNGASASVLADGDFAQYQNPMYLRIARKGSAYAAFYSLDGTNWTQVTSFTYTTAPTAVGPFAANANSSAASAVPVVMSVKFFEVQQ